VLFNANPWQIMTNVYDRHDLVHIACAEKRAEVAGGLRRRVGPWRAAALAALLALTGCDAVQVVEGNDTHVSVRYDGMMNGLDQATLLAQKACGEHGKTAKLRKTYYEGLGAGERFAFFDCV
jgi:hypothetical protein